MNTNKGKHVDQPDKPAPDLGKEGVVEYYPESDRLREETHGKVLFSSNSDEIGMDQSPADAYKDATNNHLSSLTNNEPNWLQKALITRKIANEREKVITNEIREKDEENTRHAALLTGKQREDFLTLEKDLEGKRAELATQKAKTQKEKANGITMSFITSLGKAVGAGPASVWYGWKEVKDQYKRNKNLN